MPRKTTIIETEFHINATLDQLWSALSEGDHLANWFPTRAQVVPGVGGTITYQWGESEFQGTADIIEWEPRRKLVSVEHHHGPDGKPLELRTEYHLSAAADGVRLRLVQSGFADDEGWEDYTGAFRRGWQFELRGLRHYLEHHWGEKRTTIWARRQVRADLPQVWDTLLSSLQLPKAQETQDGALLNPGKWQGKELSGTVHIFAPPMDLCATLISPINAFLRIKIDGWGQPKGVQDIHFWLSLYGDEAKQHELWQNCAQALLDGLNLADAA